MQDIEKIEYIKLKLKERNIKGFQCAFEGDDYYIAFGDKKENGYNINGIFISKDTGSVRMFLPANQENEDLLNKAKKIY